MPARLLLVAVFRLRGAGDGFAVRHAGQAHPQLGPELALDFVQRHIDLRIAQAGNQRFAGAGVARHLQAGIFLYDAAQGHRHFVQIGFGRRGNRYPVVAYRHSDGVENHLVIAGAQGVAGHGGRQLAHRADVAGGHFRQVFLALALGQV